MRPCTEPVLTFVKFCIAHTHTSGQKNCSISYVYLLFSRWVSGSWDLGCWRLICTGLSSNGEGCRVCSTSCCLWTFHPKPPRSLSQGCGTALKPASPPGSIPQELVACARNSCSSNFQLKGNNAVQLQLLLRSCVVQPHFRRHQSHLGIFLHVIIVSRKQYEAEAKAPCPWLLHLLLVLAQLSKEMGHLSPSL